MRLGVISDTHGLLRPEARHALRGVDHILHAGDIGHADVLEGLRTLAPLTVVRGNNDRGSWVAGVAHTEWVELGGHALYLLHDLADLDIDPAGAGVSIVITGHTHRPAIKRRDGVLFLNPGSAGPRRFKLPVTLALLDLSPGLPVEIRPLLGEAPATA